MDTRSRGRVRGALAWAVAGAACLLLGAAPAEAAYEHAFSFGEPGSGPGQLSAPHGIALGPDGNLYVADQDNDRIQVFGPDGAFLREWGSSGSGNGQLSAPRGVAVSSGGEVYVTDRLNDRVQVFSSAGTYLRKWGSAGTAPGRFNQPGWVDLDASGNVYVVDTFNYRVQVFTPQGVPVTQFGSQGAGAGQFALMSGIEVTADGVYVADHTAGRLQLFSTSGTFLSELGGLTHPGLLVNPWGIAEDTSESLLVAEMGVATGDAPYGVGRISRTGAALDGFGPLGIADDELSLPRDIAVAPDGDAYVTDASLGQVKVFTPTGGGGPETAIDSGPTGPINKTSATFTFSSPTAEATFECSVDAGAWVACSSPHPLTGLEPGGHSLAVRAVDAGGADPTPAVRTFTVDLEAPEPPTINTDADDPSSSAEVDFALSGEQGASLECRLDGAAFEGCGALRSYTELGEGSHVFEARQTDVAGNVGEAGQFSWEIDLTPPETSVSSAPSEWWASTSATIAFSSNEAGSSFVCTLDAVPVACSAPSKTLTGLSQGAHTFTVLAVDAAGNQDPAPEARRFNVDTVAPATTIGTHPDPTDSSTSADFSYSANEPSVSFRCRLDAGEWTGCAAGGQRYDGLALGGHGFDVLAVDAAGNVGEPDSFAWEIVPNAPPEAEAVATRNIPFSFMLDGRGSVDPDGDIVAYEWRASRKAGEPGTVLSTAASFEYRTNPRHTYVTLTVTDDDGATDEDQIVLRGSL